MRPAAEMGALSDAAIRLSVCLSVCPMPLAENRCVLERCLL